jgi:hypothetical protein
MVIASALPLRALQICGEPHALITERNLGDTRIGYKQKTPAPK